MLSISYYDIIYALTILPEPGLTSGLEHKGEVFLKEWTREEKYRYLKDPQELKDLYERISSSVYRQKNFLY